MNSTMTNTENEKLQEYHGIITILQFVQAILVTGSNGLLITVYVLLGPSQRKNGNYLILTQAFADLFIGALLWYEIVGLNMDELSQYTNLVHVIYSGLLEYSFTVCVGTLMMNAIERYILVTRPIYHKHNMTTDRLKRITLLLWVTALIPSMCLVGLMQFDIAQSNTGRVIRYSYVFDVLMLVVLCTVASIHWISLKTANQYNDMEVSHDDAESAPSLPVVKDTKLIKLFAVVMVIFTVTYFPIFLGRLVYDVGGFDSLSDFEHTVVVDICHFLYKFSAICNPLMAFYIQKDYREKVGVCFSRDEGQNGIEVIEDVYDEHSCEIDIENDVTSV